MASFKGGENSTDPQRCKANSKQTGKQCKNSAIFGARVCRYHGGKAPQVMRRAAERLRDLEHPAIGVLEDLITDKTTPPAVRLMAANSLLDRLAALEPELPQHDLIDLTKLSTPLLRQII